MTDVACSYCFRFRRSPITFQSILRCFCWLMFNLASGSKHYDETARHHDKYFVSKQIQKYILMCKCCPPTGKDSSMTVSGTFPWLTWPSKPSRTASPPPSLWSRTRRLMLWRSKYPSSRTTSKERRWGSTQSPTQNTEKIFNTWFDLLFYVSEHGAQTHEQWPLRTKE